MITISYEIALKATIQLLHYEKRVQNAFYTKIIETSIHPTSYEIALKATIQLLHYEKRDQNAFYTKIIETSIPLNFDLEN
jgi:hypothetical protein